MNHSSQPTPNRSGNQASLALAIALIVLVSAVGMILIPNPLGTKVLAMVKAQGYLEYTPEEATRLAYNRCGGCHEVEKITKYCARCGPPFIIVANFMKKFIDVANAQSATQIDQFTNAELVAIIQVWNGLIGNWEADWRTEDLKKLLSTNPGLIPLLETPPQQRPIENALKGKAAPGSYKNYESGGLPTDKTTLAPPLATGQ